MSKLLPTCLFALILAVGALSAQEPARFPRTWYLSDGRDLEGALVSLEASAVTIKGVDGKIVSVPLPLLDGHGQRYVANVRTAAGHEFREWHFDKLPKELADFPTTVKGAFLRVVCEDHKFATACVELLRDDYTRRFYPLKALTAEDRALAEKLQAAVEAKAPQRAEAVPYPTRYESYTPERDAAVCNFHETPHFLFHWGNEQTGSGKDWWLDGRQQLTFRWFERVWDFFEQANAPMPMATGTPDEKTRSKIPVYITGTGLPKHKDGFAFGGKSIIMHPGALGPGSSVVGHEFTHTMQLHLGGFRNSPFVGWFWECHANWSSHQWMPDYPPTFEGYSERAHYELNSSRHNYGSWLFLQQLAEDPRFGSGFCYEVWLKNRRDEKDSSIEDPLQTFMRLGVERGVWQGDGAAGFGDAIGEMAARMVALDFSPQWSYMRSRRGIETGDGAARIRTLLEPVPDRAGWWRPIWSHAPRQYGVNFVELIPDGKSETVEVELAGMPSENAGWRATLVAVDAQGMPRYSRTTHGGKLSLKLHGEKRVTLAIAATPTRYVPDEFRPGYGKKPRFTYELAVRGAKPAAEPPRRVFAKGDGAPHANGGGWVGRGAKVAPTAFVGPEALVLDGAKVSDTARIEGRAVVRNGAKVGGSAVVGDWAVVQDTAAIGGEARVRGNVRVGNSVEVSGRARVLDYVHLNGKGRIGDDVLVRGWGEINTDAEAPLGGGVIAGEDLECHLKGRVEPINGGMLYGYLNAEIFAKELEDNRYLYARWNCDKANGSLLTDVNADCTGILRGAPTFSRDGERRVLTLNGRDQYAVFERHLADSAALTLDLVLKWAGGSANQIAFDFGGPDCALLFTPRDARGRATFLIRKGAVIQYVSAPGPLTVGRWTRVTLALGGGTGRIFLDGQPVASAPMTLVPGDLGITAGYLGRASTGGGFFAGQFDDVGVYRRAIADVKELPEPWKTPSDWRVKGGAWTLDAGVFRQGNATAKDAVLFLPGSETWTDYTITLQARRIAGSNAFRVHFRADSPEKAWVVDFGQEGKACAVKKNGVTFGGPNTFVAPNWDEWQDVRVEVRGEKVTIELGGKKATETSKPIEPSAGGFALGTRESGAEFRNIKVIGADGKTLFASAPVK